MSIQHIAARIRQIKIDWLSVGTLLVVVGVAVSIMLTMTPYRERPEVPFAEQSQATVMLRAEVTSVTGSSGYARIIDGSQTGQVVPLQFFDTVPRVGSTVLVSENTTVNTPNSVIEPWRLPVVVLLIAVMAVLVIMIGGRQGIMSIAGLFISIGVVALYIVPSVLAGSNALFVCVVAAFVIATVAIIVAHRVRWRTAISLLSIYLVLAGVVILTCASGWLANLSGVYDETSTMLGMAGAVKLDMYGILLGGIIIASLGVLDDVVITQVAAIDELRHAKPHASRRELFARGMSVGREHLSALINTLALAYVGVALPTVLVMSRAITDSAQLLVTVNYEYIAVELIRIVISSLGIIVAIPLSTLLAVILIGKKHEIIAILKRVQPNSWR